MAHRCTQLNDGISGIEIKDAHEILMPEMVLQFQAAAGHEGIGDADGGGTAEGRAGVKFIIPLQEGTVNDAEEIIPVVVPVFFRQVCGDILQLLREALPARDFKAALQRCRHHVPVLLPVLPQVGIEAVVHAACVGYIKYIAQDGPAPAGVDEGDALGTAPDIPTHFLIPEIPLRTGRCIWSLGVDHQLFREGVFLKILSRGNVRLNFYLFSFLYSFKGNRRHSYREAAVITSIILALPPGHSSVL